MPTKRLIVAGDGPMMNQVKGHLKPNITLLPQVPFSQLVQYMQQAKAFVFAAEEDFGITLVEAQAAGTPVIAFGKGGAAETVIPNKTGILFNEQSTEGIISAVHDFESNKAKFNYEAISLHADQFSEDKFRYRLANLVNNTYSDFKNGIHIR
jgi:glycosyltransferase involved in cell wall biosynthesis